MARRFEQEPPPPAKEPRSWIRRLAAGIIGLAVGALICFFIAKTAGYRPEGGLIIGGILGFVAGFLFGFRRLSELWGHWH